VAIAALENHRGARRPRVFVHVVQGFLAEPVDVGLDVRDDAPILEASAVELRRDVEIVRPFADELGQRRDQSKIVERRRPQLAREEVEVLVELLGRILRVMNPGQHGTRRGILCEQLELQPEAGKLLPEVIVDLARNTAALVLLHRHQSFDERRVLLRRRLPTRLEELALVDVQHRDEVFALAGAAARPAE